jgi:hypothetical protein
MQEGMPATAVLARFIGEWEMVISMQGRPLSRGRTTFEWLEGRQFVVQHADAAATNEAPPGWAEASPFPVTAVIGLDDTSGALAMLYADARGVFRIYQARLEGDEWTLWRDASGFFQRFVGSFGAGNRTIAGRWEASEDGQDWNVDFELTYTRVDPL